MHKKMILLIIAIIFSSTLGFTQVQKRSLKDLDFLVGKWKTVSEFTSNGEKVEGDLEYSYVLGANWIYCKFVGNHPSRPYWEAVAMIKWDDKKKAFVSWDYFNEADPVISLGSFIKENVVSFVGEYNGMEFGIDYHDMGDGTVYQENWARREGNRIVTLKTYYTPANK